jgi:hypothetical protein
MESSKHREKAQRIERSLAKCLPADYELRIEAAMLAGTHWLNAALHDLGATRPEQDVLHTYMLTVNEFRRLGACNAELVRSLSAIEDLRPLHVRGDVDGGPAVADRACALLERIRAIAEAAGAAPQPQRVR